MKINWKIKLGIILLIISILIYTFAYFSFHEPEKVLFYIVIDLAFVPLDILVVVLVVETVINKKEKEAILEKLDMILGVFFSEIGTDFLSKFSKIDQDDEKLHLVLKNISKWSDDEFSQFLEKLEKNNYRFHLEIENEKKEEFLSDIQKFLSGKRDFLIRLLENPNLLEKDSFSNLLLAIFHLDEELERRKSFKNLPITDFKHVLGDIDRVYSNLIYEWVNYLYYLKNHYPYMFSISIRTNPFDYDIDIYVKE